MNDTHVTKKVIQGFIIGAILFFIFIPIIIAIVSYIPPLRLESDLTGFEYFKATFFNDFSLKLIIGTFLSPFLTVGVTFAAFKLLDIRDKRREEKSKSDNNE